MAFTIVLILVGVGTVLYTITALIGLVLEGDLLELVGRRRMDRKIAGMSGHVVLCGYGRVGRALGHELAATGTPVVVVERDRAALGACPFPVVEADATSDESLRQAGVARARTLAAGLPSDADNLFVTLSGRALNPGLFIVARAREESTVDKLLRAGADRVVNPQRIGGARMAAFVVQPNVAEFLDVVMHDRSLEFRLGEAQVGHRSRLVGATLGSCPPGCSPAGAGRARSRPTCG
jgi:voltage-gated potassium channel